MWLKNLLNGKSETIDNVVDEGSGVAKTAIKRGQYVKLTKIGLIALVVMFIGIAILIDVRYNQGQLINILLPALVETTKEL